MTNFLWEELTSTTFNDTRPNFQHIVKNLEMMGIKLNRIVSSLLTGAALFALPTAQGGTPTAEQPKVITRTVECGESEIVIRAVVRAIIDASRDLGGYCDEQNNIEARAGHMHCPAGTCMSQHEAGGWKPPILDVKISNSSSGGFPMGGMPDSITPIRLGVSPELPGFSVPNGMPHLSSTAHRSLSHLLQGPPISSRPFDVSISLHLSLAREPDKLQCVNPMSQGVRDQLLAKIMDVALAEKSLCAPKP